MNIMTGVVFVGIMVVQACDVMAGNKKNKKRKVTHAVQANVVPVIDAVVKLQAHRNRLKNIQDPSEYLQEVQNYHGSLDIEFKDGSTLLHKVAAQNITAFNIMVQMGANPHVKDRHGNTAIDYARILSPTRQQAIDLSDNSTSTANSVCSNISDRSEALFMRTCRTLSNSSFASKGSNDAFVSLSNISYASGSTDSCGSLIDAVDFMGDLNSEVKSDAGSNCNSDSYRSLIDAVDFMGDLNSEVKSDTGSNCNSDSISLFAPDNY